MGSIWGEQLKMSIFGESHGPAVGVVLDGLPAGEEIDFAKIRSFMARRAPGRRPWSTARREDDQVRVLSGLYQGRTCGTPLCAVIDNQDMRPGDYPERMAVPRPGHADYTGWKRYRGYNDPRGGGHFSGRLTAALCFAGAAAKQILGRRGIIIAARIREIGGIEDKPLDAAKVDEQELLSAAARDFPVLDRARGRQMVELIEKVRQERDSLGGIIECFALNLPPGVGDPIFGGMEPRLASIVYSIPAVQGVSFGSGFNACRMRGSEHNDIFYFDGQGEVRSETNRAGGINGGITNGMPIVLNAAIKPTASIGKPQAGVDLHTGQAKTFSLRGRHDPCIVPRAVPAVEAAVAVAVLDALLVAYGIQGHLWTK